MRRRLPPPLARLRGIKHRGPVTLTGFSCGDSCYLEFTDGGGARTALCRAPVCSDWADAGRLPRTLQGKRATARFGTSNQVDAAGNIMSRDFPTVEELHIPLNDPGSPARPAQGQAMATGPLGLIKGVYTSGGDCGSIANAGLRIYDGVGLSGSATKACRTTIVSRSGRSYKIANDCAATYDGKRSTENFTVTVSGSGRFTLGDGESGTYDYCPVDRLDPAMRRYAPDSAPDSASDTAPDTADAPIVPPRFRGLFAADRKACAEDYAYNPAFQNVTIKARSVNFFETGGPVTDVNIAGDRAAITLRETVGDGKYTRAIYLALNRDGTVRYRPGKSEPPRIHVRCDQ